MKGTELGLTNRSIKQGSLIFIIITLFEVFTSRHVVPTVLYTALYMAPGYLIVKHWLTLCGLVLIAWPLVSTWRSQNFLAQTPKITVEQSLPRRINMTFLFRVLFKLKLECFLCNEPACVILALFSLLFAAETERFNQ